MAAGRRWPRHTGGAGGRSLLLVVLAVAVLGSLAFLGSGPAAAAGGAVRRPAGYNANTVARGDNNSTALVTIPFQVRFFNSKYTQGYINTNGTMSFRAPWTAFDPSSTFQALRDDAYCPFWADVDTTNATGGTVTYSSSASPPQVDGHNAFIVTWEGVGYHAGRTDKLNTFQLVLIDRSDTGAGNYDIEFNYDQVQWDRATDPTASTTAARAGIAQRSPATGWELPGSATSGAYLDGGPNALITHSQASSVPGRYVWQVRGNQTAAPPSIALAFATKTLEGNSRTPSPGYAGYSGAADATATLNEPYITLTSLVRSPAAGTYLPLGNNTVTWTATDSNGSVTTATQTITVVDTTPPTNPTTLGSTHPTGTWSNAAAVTATWAADATDTCSGVAGYSVAWAATSSVPPTASNTPSATLSASRTLADGTWYLNLRAVDAAGNWASGFRTLGPFLIDTVPPVTASNVPAGWSTASTFSLVLTPTDPSGPVAGTLYGIDGALLAPYSGPVPVTADGTHTVTFRSTDAAGNAEATVTATLRKDSAAPSVPGTPVAGTVTTSTAGFSWTASTDAVSGIALYRVYRDGSLLATTTATSYTDTGLTPGTTHSYRIVAVDNAGNASGPSGTLAVDLPDLALWLTLDTTAVDMGTVQPGTRGTVADATTARVGGVGSETYTISVTGVDFTAGNPSSPTPTLPVSSLKLTTHGQVSLAERALSTSSFALATQASGTLGIWEHGYRFDFAFDAPLDVEPDTYTGHVVYTVIQQ